MSSYNKHLTLDDRIAIQKTLKEGRSFVDIAAVIGKDPSTISKEVKAHLTVKETGTRSRGFNTCAKRNKCDKSGLCKEGCLPVGMAWHYEPYCAGCSRCNSVCPDFVEEKCRALTKAPYVCNACHSIRSCTLRKQVYDAKEAQQA